MTQEERAAEKYPDIAKTGDEYTDILVKDTIKSLRSGYIEGLEDAQQQPPQDADTNEWVSVEEVPKDNGEYHVWDKGFAEAIYMDGEWKSKDRPIRNAHGKQVLRVTLNPSHWRHLPQPPKD